MDLTHTLHTLAHHLHHLQTEYWETGLTTARTSQTGVKHHHTQPTTPGNDTQLDYLNDIQNQLKELCTNISHDLHIPIPPQPQTGAFWPHWLLQHHHQLNQLTWHQDLQDNLQDITAELTHHIHPTQPHTHQLPDYATVEEIAKATGKTPNTIHKWCTRHNITAYTQGGKTHYKTTELK